MVLQISLNSYFVPKVFVSFLFPGKTISIRPSFIFYFRLQSTWMISCCPLFLSGVPFPGCRFLNFGKYLLCLGRHFACHFDHFVLVSSEAHFLHLLVMDSRIAYELREAGVDLLKVSLLDLQPGFHV